MKKYLILLWLLIASPAWADIKDNLISYWELGEASGTRADSHGTNTLSDNSSVGSATGKVGNAASFSSTNYLSIIDNSTLSVADTDFTFVAWVNLNNKTVHRTIASKYATADGSSSYYMLYRQDTDRFRFWICSGTGFANCTFSDANTLGSPSTSTWYFIVGWHDATANTINIQVNNGTVDSVGYTFGSFDSDGPLRIGNNFFGETMDGLIDQAGFWKRVLTAGERTQLYNGGNGLSYGALTTRRLVAPVIFQ